MSWQTRLMLLIVGALIAGDALHWVVGGASATHSSLRNALVIGQCAVGVGLLIWAWRARARVVEGD